MQAINERCCGLDVHKKVVVACVLTPEGRELRSFGTMTDQLLELADWLVAKAVAHVAMESTGVYWKPVYNLLEGLGLELLVVNAQHIKAVPGRKTDLKDAEWIAELLRHGLLRGSFIPERAQRELRELVRYRTTLVRQRAQIVQRIEKLLEGANIKLSSVISDIAGKSGRAMLAALASGRTDTAQLADLAQGRMRSKRAQIERSLQGFVGEQQRTILDSELRVIEFLEAEIAKMDEEVAARMKDGEPVLALLDTIPGVGRRGAEQVLVEIGRDMGRFPSAGHLASWARICPGTEESAGRRGSAWTGRGNPWLKGALVELARAAVRSRGTYLGAQYQRIAARRGKQRATIAVAHTILVIVYHILRTGQPYHELGDAFFDEREREGVARRAVRRLERLGFKVSVEVA